MKRLFAVLLILGLCAGLAPAKTPWLVKDGYPVVTMDVNLRPRFEIDGRDFDTETGLHDYGTLRTLLGINLMPDKDVLVRIRLKESRELGTQGSNSSPTAEFSAQEAYLQVDNLLDKGITLQAGRFEYTHGRNRLFGPGNWNVNGPRTYDGIRLGMSPGYGNWDLIWFKLDDYDYGSPRRAADRNLFIVSGELLDGHIQPIFSADLNNAVIIEDKANQRFTAGLYYGRMIGDIKLDLDGYYQSGTLWGRDLAAWLAAVEVKYLFDGPRKMYLGAGLDVTSGNKFDADTPDDEDNVFYAPFMSRHVYRGWMDFFTDERRGLMDGYLTLGVQPRKGVKLMANVHSFTYLNEAQRTEIVPGGVETTEYTAVGQEIDLRAIIALHKTVNLDAGYGLFLASEDWRPDGDPAHFAWAAFVVTF